MEEDKVLQAIGQLAQSIQGVNDRLDGIDKRLAAVEDRTGHVENHMGDMETKLTGVESHMSAMENKLTSVEDRTGRVEVLLEHDIPKQINLLAEGHKTILECLPEADELDGIRSRVCTLERVVTDHTSEISALKRAN